MGAIQADLRSQEVYEALQIKSQLKHCDGATSDYTRQLPAGTGGCGFFK